jgi:micrococcal nuclease
MKRACSALLCVVLLVLNGTAHGDASRAESGHEFSARVIAVLDGDTVLILRQLPASGERRARGPVKIRLAEIDAPEKEQAYGASSHNALAEMVLHKQIRVHIVAVDKYGRSVAQLVVDGLSVNEEMVRRGMAWEYSRFHSDRSFIALEAEARQSRRGLWAQRDPTPPWQWRKQHAVETGNSGK